MERSRYLLQGWPALAGIAFAAFVSFGMFSGEARGHELASIVAASALVYLIASALQKPLTSWLAFFGSVVVITASKMKLTGVDATWLLIGAGVLFAAYGVVRGAVRPTSGLPLQATAMVAFGAVAGTALFVEAVIGAYLVAAGLFAHGAWDVYHHRANTVVSRSMAEFGFFLDVLLATAIVVATTIGA